MRYQRSFSNKHHGSAQEKFVLVMRNSLTFVPRLGPIGGGGGGLAAGASTAAGAGLGGASPS